MLLSPSSSLQPSISPENGDFDSDTDLQFFDPSEMLVNDRSFFICDSGGDTTEDEAADNGDIGKEEAGDEASENDVDGNFLNFKWRRRYRKWERWGFGGDVT